MRGKIAEESKVGEGGRVPSATSPSGKRGEGKGGVGDGRRWGFIGGARAMGLYRSLLRSGEGSFVISCKGFAYEGWRPGTLVGVR